MSVTTSQLDSIDKNKGLTLFSHEGERPSEDVHEIWQPIWMRGAVELTDTKLVSLVTTHLCEHEYSLHNVGLVLEYGSLIGVHVQVIWS
jgi:hypothetical protein